MGDYRDIIKLKRPVSYRHRPMTIYNRAAQFNPFEALAGHRETVNETGRVTCEKKELCEDKKIILDMYLSRINELPDRELKFKIIYFKPDVIKSGGGYVITSGVIKKKDELKRTIVLDNNSVINIDDIYDISPVDTKYDQIYFFSSS